MPSASRDDAIRSQREQAVGRLRIQGESNRRAPIAAILALPRQGTGPSTSCCRCSGKGPHCTSTTSNCASAVAGGQTPGPSPASPGSDARRDLKDHPTVKPTAMLEDILLDLSNRRELGLERAPCIRIDHLNAEEQRVLRLAVNRLSERVLDALKVEFEELIVADAPIEVSGSLSTRSIRSFSATAARGWRRGRSSRGLWPRRSRGPAMSSSWGRIALFAQTPPIRNRCFA
jgi:hypothetical protein